MKKKSIPNQIRIIGGKWKGNKIPILHKSMIRPTTNYIRETLFNWLYNIIPAAECLDCFAGSGALGLEALSRGAHNVTFIDINSICITELLKTTKLIAKKNINNINIIHSDCRIWLKQSISTYDVIFIDPPFQQNIIPEIIILLEEHNHFKKKSWIYLETSIKNQNIFKKNKIIPTCWLLHRKKTTSTVAYFLYIRKS